MKNIGEKFWLVLPQVIDGAVVLDKEATEFEITDHCMSSVMAKSVLTGDVVRVSRGYATKQEAESKK
jgi:hypothetical protein